MMRKLQPAVKDSASTRHGNYAYAAIAAIFTLLQLLAVIWAPVSVSLAPGSDTWEYQELAAGIRHGCGFARYIDGACAQPEILRTPGYPIFLALFPNWRMPLVVQALLCGLICLLAGIWVGRRWGFRVGVAAQLLIFANIPSFVLSAMLLSETLFQTVLFLAVLTPLIQLTRARDRSSILTCAAISGVLIGCLSLIRPVAIFVAMMGFMPFLSFDSISGRQKVAAILLSVGIPLAMLLGWSWRNYSLKGYFGISTVSALNLYLYRAGGVLALDTGRPLPQVQDELINDIGASNLRLYENDVTPPLVTEMNRRAIQILASHPWETAVVTVQGFVWLLIAPSRTLLANLLATQGGSKELGPGSGRVTLSRLTRLLDEVAQSKLLTALIAFQFLVVAVVWTGVLLAILKVRNSSAEFRAWIIYLLAVAVLLLVAASGAEAAVRFRSVTMPLLAIAAAMGYFASESQVIRENRREGSLATELLAPGHGDW
ncbi:MAG: hypothetical protein ABSD30_07050 [Candidatus Binatus sp.]